MINFKKTLQEHSDKLDRKFVFLQIGCNDGKMADPISDLIIDNGWSGLMVDANSYYLELAYRHHKDKNIINFKNKEIMFLNTGVIPISDNSEAQYVVKKFYSINPKSIRPEIHTRNGQPYFVYGDIAMAVESSNNCAFNESDNPLDYLCGINSFDYNTVLSHIEIACKKDDVSGQIARQIFSNDKDIWPSFINIDYVRSTDINNLFLALESSINNSSIDLLQTDLEFWDVKIMNEIEQFEKKPKFIHFEAPGGMDSSLRDKFDRCGYDIFVPEDTGDQFAILRNP